MTALGSSRRNKRIECIEKTTSHGPRREMWDEVTDWITDLSWTNDGEFGLDWVQSQIKEGVMEALPDEW